MLRWKPAQTKESILAVQQAIHMYPHDINPRELHYFVTKTDVGHEFGIAADAVSKEHTSAIFDGLGIDRSKELFDLSLEGDDREPAYFIPESTLLRLKLEVEEASPPRRWRKRASAASEARPKSQESRL